MRTLLFISVLSCLLAASLVSQTRQDVEHRLRSVADGIISETSYEVIDTSSGAVLAIGPSTHVIPTARFRSDYNDWTYFYGVILSGMIRAGETLGDTKYAAYADRNFDFIFDHVEYFRDQWEVHQVTRGSLYRMHRLNMLDDCGAIGSALVESYVRTKDPRALRMLQRIANYITNVQLRNEERMLVRPDPHFMTLWADDLYMSVPFLVRWGAVSGERRYLDDAVRQVILFHAHLWNQDKRVLHHAWFNDRDERSVGLWGRANGWVMMAHTELLTHLPVEHPQRDTLLALFRRHAEGLARWQSPSGLWHQLLDDDASYLETSSTAMFAYGMARGARLGWLDASYASKARSAWSGVASRIRPDGTVEGICRGTEVGFTPDFYRQRPTPPNDPRGLGAILLAGSELLRLTHERPR